MPDESCRTCGGELVTHSLCSECRKVTQKKCSLCQNVTRKQFHDACVKKETLTISRGSQVLQAIHNERSGNHNRKLHSYALVIGIVGFFILGISTASYFDIFQSIASDVKVMDSNNISSEQMIHSAMISQKSFHNCLAYGSGQSVTVACPTDYGSAYKAILDMPKGLSEKFSEAVFSIRGLSLKENSDGSVVLQYLDNEYKTNFFAN
ncbi:MAG: hypothetical protein E6K98_05475 [Thaumarchaeota archaeon]|nr:MAG: hypothetical protein E6K98_05475 [Nitrososphaerota archaeon]TLX93837.1 MAG: hypothetical protein E6K91_08065 [Nitrososphaerota archaeon]